ncbi:MAG: hypothetical protein OXE78_13665 [Gammaproteobacteria bacterium]|nr:hypothetical protein [Gammaproteobacteria bacterium]
MSTLNSPPSLLDWFANQPENKFPPNGGSLYTIRLEQVTGILNSQVHSLVGVGAALADRGFLTDHGPDHIKTVIQRASLLLAHPESTFPQFTPYEIFMLLLAIHFHDVGNIFGREEHEKKHSQVMRQVESIIGDEMVERNAILKIAQAHGGRINGNKDTLSSLVQEDFVLGQRIRYRALAALLRFADELADDCHRAARYADKLGVIPPESEVYHAYAKSLHSVIVDLPNHIVRLHFSLLRKEAIRTYGKKLSETNQIEQVFLLDEIYLRTIKMHLERIYCMRFLRTIIQIDAVEVSIEVYEETNSLSPCIDTIGYRLEEEGYPPNNNSSLRDLCPNVIFDGCGLSEYLQKGAE